MVTEYISTYRLSQKKLEEYLQTLFPGNEIEIKVSGSRTQPPRHFAMMQPGHLLGRLSRQGYTQHNGVRY